VFWPYAYDDFWPYAYDDIKQRLAALARAAPAVR
jgi:hypothetical protein